MGLDGRRSAFAFAAKPDAQVQRIPPGIRGEQPESDNGCSSAYEVLSPLTVTVASLHNPCPRLADRQGRTPVLCATDELCRVPILRCVCSWCKKLLREGDQPFPVSHTICPSCMARSLADLEKSA